MNNYISEIDTSLKLIVLFITADLTHVLHNLLLLRNCDFNPLKSIMYSVKDKIIFMYCRGNTAIDS